MSVLARLKDIENLVSTPLLRAQDELDGGVMALSSLRNLLAAQNDEQSQGLFQLVCMIEDKLKHANAQLQALAYNTFGTIPHNQ